MIFCMFTGSFTPRGPITDWQTNLLLHIYMENSKIFNTYHIEKKYIMSFKKIIFEQLKSWKKKFWKKYLFIIENRFWIDDSSLPHITVGILWPSGGAPVHLTAKTLFRQRSPQVSVGLRARPVKAALFTLFSALFTSWTEIIDFINWLA